ncbi:hypothetical protein MGYG_07541 [Nannizzia gypsea CBS 118893]|uniref:Uncharacterized protein n=1 Tax=Arthroderma gypseum (strain ATCC MYA-4604 / CBS 118893) TaxID=535722 RepID=E4V3G2_ARTGP|nr:hypothetical protein MGYG_07541 [Nannizzia gypsea CBS 118893]EFR04536.1 hypothetical protein MGYG_07541 [Nannizzia gypsea CBS 118893]
MSSDFFLDSPVPPKLDLAGARSRFYYSPPPASAASSLSLCRTLSSPLMSSCKRARYGYGGLDGRMVGLDDRVIWDHPSPVSRIASPVPLANTEYLLAEGGLDTGLLTSARESILGFSSQRDGDNEETELDYRPTRYRKPSRTMADVPVTPSNVEGTKRKRDSPAPQDDGVSVKSTPGWGEAVLNLVGGVAGKVWNFCLSAPFRGFHAGGGRGYDMDSSTATVQPSQKRDRLTPSQKRRSSRLMDDVPVPGRYPVDDHCQIDKPRRESIHNNWVLVKEDEDSQESSPSSCNSRKHSRRNSVVHHVPARRSVARLQPKRPMTPITPTRSTNISPQIYSSSSTPSIYKTPPKHTTVANPDDSPLSRETQRHAAKLRRKEREEDASIRRLNHQLKAMIREGRQALGTRIEVDEMDLDEWD